LRCLSCGLLGRGSGRSGGMMIGINPNQQLAMYLHWMFRVNFLFLLVFFLFFFVCLFYLTFSKRFYVTQDDDLTEIGSEELEDLGEANMADSQTLVDFITWAVDNFPAKKYALIMSDHGAGWPGGWNDPDPGGLGPDAVPVADLFGVDGLWLMELDQALEQARDQTGVDKFELIGFDACLMAQLEVFSAIQPHGNYSVASQELEPAVGWAYASFLRELTQNPIMDGADLSQSIVASYIDEDQRVVDDEARQVMLDTSFGGAQARRLSWPSFWAMISP